MRASSREFRRHLPLVVAVLVASSLLVRNLIVYASIADDAYISFRYLDNWLAGLGLVFNAGDRVEGYTNFFWIILLAPLRGFGLEPELASLLVSLAALALLAWAVFRAASDLSGNPRAGWFALILAMGSAQLARWTVSGMETTCFAALLALANQQLARERAHGLGSSLAFGVAAVTRPTGVMHAGLAFLCAAFATLRGRERRHSRRLLAALGLFAAFPVAHLIFRLIYYGDPLPNTAYVKLTGETASLLPGGLHYLEGFLFSGAALLVLAAAPVLFERRLRSWVTAALTCQVVAQMAYSVMVGGDYFPFHRFLVPVIPALCVLAGMGVESSGRRLGPKAARPLPVLVLALASLQTVLAHRSEQQTAFDQILEVRAERQVFAEWLSSDFPPDSTLAINAAGIIPYRTGFATIDMLGLNDRHIARSSVRPDADGTTFVGHRKHDGDYVCSRKPDVVITSGARFHPGRSAEEAIAQAALNSFPGDREFLRAADCRGRYRATAMEMSPGKYLVVYRRSENRSPDSLDRRPATAEGWFQLGTRRMRNARLKEAVQAFRASLALAPENPAALANLGFCLMDLSQNADAVEIFEAALERAPAHYDALFGLAMAHEKLGHRDRASKLWLRYIHEAPDSPWKDVAEKHLGGHAPAAR